jgi:hypothetical protein
VFCVFISLRVTVLNGACKHIPYKHDPTPKWQQFLILEVEVSTVRLWKTPRCHVARDTEYSILLLRFVMKVTLTVRCKSIFVMSLSHFILRWNSPLSKAFSAPVVYGLCEVSSNSVFLRVYWNDLSTKLSCVAHVTRTGSWKLRTIFGMGNLKWMRHLGERY